MDWGKFTYALWYRQTRGMTQAEKGDYMDKTVDACVDEVRGETPLADNMMEEAEAYVFKKREAGRLGGMAKARNASEKAHRPSTARKSVAPLSTATKTLAPSSTPLADPTQERNKENKKEINIETPIQKPTALAIQNAPARTPPPARDDARPLGAFIRPPSAMVEQAQRQRATSPVDQFLAAPKGGLSNFAPVMWARIAAAYVGEKERPYTMRTFDGIRASIGDAAFRRVFERFVANVESGEEPNNRAAALTAELRSAQATAQENGKGKGGAA